MAHLDYIQKIPKYIEAEQAILGNIIVNPALFEDVPFLKASDFYLEQHQQIFAAVVQMYENSRSIDTVTIINALTGTGKYTQGDAAKYVKALAEMSSGCPNITEYATIIRDKSLLRRLIDSMREVSENAYSENGSTADLINMAEERIYEISNDRYSKEFIPVRDAILLNYETLNLQRTNPEALAGIKTNFEHLDNTLLGLGKGDLVIVGGRPGMGKTTFCLNIAANVAKSTKKAVAIFSLEMTAEQLSSRLLCSEALIDSSKMRTGKLDQDEFKRLAEAASVLGETNILINDSSDITVTEMKSKLRKIKDLGLVVIDYLQLMHGEGRGNENRVNEVASITRGIKIMGKELGVPVILCSQLSRVPKDQKESKKPTMQDLRDSGSIEQDADIILLLYRPDYYDTEKSAVQDTGDHEKCQCIIAKNRHGVTGSVNFAWYGRHYRFITSDERDDSNE